MTREPYWWPMNEPPAVNDRNPWEVAEEVPEDPWELYPTLPEEA